MERPSASPAAPIATTLDNLNFGPPQRTSTVQSLDLMTNWQGPCRICHHHHHAEVINIHVSRDRTIKEREFKCEKCSKLLFCLGAPERRLSLLSQHTEDGDPSQPSCSNIPPDLPNVSSRINNARTGRRNGSPGSSQRSTVQSARSGDHLPFRTSNRASLSNRSTENHSNTAHGTVTEETGRERGMQPLSVTDNRLRPRHRTRFRAWLASHLPQRFQRFFQRSANRHPPVSPNQAAPPRHEDARPPSSPNFDGSPLPPVIRDAENESTHDNNTLQGFSGDHDPILDHVDQSHPYPSDDPNNLRYDYAHIGQEGGHLGPEEIVSKIRDAKTAIAKSRLICECGDDCHCKCLSIHRSGYEGRSDRLTNFPPNSSVRSVSEMDSTRELMQHDGSSLYFIGAWTGSEQQVERPFESQPADLAHRYSMASSETTIAVSHDPSEPLHALRGPSPSFHSPASALRPPSQFAASRSSLRVSTTNLAAPLETVGEASSTSENSQHLRIAFDNSAGNRSGPLQTNDGPVNENSGERETTDQNHPSTQPPDSSERNSGPISSQVSGLPHAKTF